MRPGKWLYDRLSQVVVLLSAIAFGGLGIVHQGLAGQWIGVLELPLQRELHLVGSTLEEEERAGEGGVVVLIRNGTVGATDVSFQKRNSELRADRVLLGTADLTRRVVREGARGRFDDREVKINAMRIPGLNEVALVLLSEETELSPNLTEPALVLREGRRAGRPLVMATAQVVIGGIILILVGVLATLCFTVKFDGR